VNPWNIKEVSSAIGEALNMSHEEKERKHKINFQYVKTHSTQQWADDFMKYVQTKTLIFQISTLCSFFFRLTLTNILCSKLIEITTNAELGAGLAATLELPEHDVIQQYSKSNNRLLILVSVTSIKILLYLFLLSLSYLFNF